MGEFSLSSNTNIGLSGVDISVNPSKNNPNTIFYTTPTSPTDTSVHQAQSRSAMQDELVDKTAVSGANTDEVGVTTIDKTGECDTNSNTADLSDKLNEQVGQNTKSGTAGLQLFHASEPNTPSGNLWSTAIEDGYVPNLPNVNGGLGFQNFPSPAQAQLFGNTVNQNQGRRAITATHNFPHNVGRQQQPSHPLYKSYGPWTNVSQSWSGSSAWNRGRSVPNLTPLQQMGVASRKPSPTFNHQHQQVISPVKFRRSTSYPGKGHFPQPPTLEITNMDEARELLSYQVMCVFGYPLHTTPRLASQTECLCPLPLLMLLLQTLLVVFFRIVSVLSVIFFFIYIHIYVNNINKLLIIMFCVMFSLHIAHVQTYIHTCTHL